jgi:hypothetical protein
MRTFGATCLPLILSENEINCFFLLVGLPSGKKVASKCEMQKDGDIKLMQLP